MKYGLEKEYFVKKGDEYVLATGLPMDECGYLAEVRGDCHSDPSKAVALFRADDAKLKAKAAALGLTLSDEPVGKIPPKLARTAARRFGKGTYPVGRGNMYGKDFSLTDRVQRAGMHVHFSDQQEVKDKEGRNITTIPRILDMPRIIYKLDQAFAAEIKAAKRIPGMYEMKPHGFEYRSLPANVDLDRLTRVLETLFTASDDEEPEALREA
jgi:hypothetical protein